MKTAKINEIFTSIQGEGPYIGYKQLFIRFCGCNLNCAYCDTEFKDGKDYSSDELAEIINAEKAIHSVSLTGGEPLLHSDFLLELLPKVNKIIYLETNATLSNALEEVLQHIDIISADLKLETAGGKDNFEEAEAFFAVAKNASVNTFYHPELFAKVVFNDKITDEEIKKCTELAKKINIPIILQPQMGQMTLSEEVTVEKIEEIMSKFSLGWSDIRLIPQVHKFLLLR